LFCPNLRTRFKEAGNKLKQWLLLRLPVQVILLLEQYIENKSRLQPWRNTKEIGKASIGDF
jgi:hypothetical protein